MLRSARAATAARRDPRQKLIAMPAISIATESAITNAATTGGTSADAYASIVHTR